MSIVCPHASWAQLSERIIKNSKKQLSGLDKMENEWLYSVTVTLLMLFGALPSLTL